MGTPRWRNRCLFCGKLFPIEEGHSNVCLECMREYIQLNRIEGEGEYDG